MPATGWRMVHGHPFISRRDGPGRREHRHRRCLREHWGPGIGAEIMGRNNFGPQRGPWTDEEWKGWWGEEPPFHTPVFVLTHHVRPSIEMKGGTTFHFIDASPAQALAAAKKAAGGLDVHIGGGPAAIRQFLAADLIDHMHVALVPILLGRGESLWDGLEGLEERFAIESVSSPSGVTHVTFTPSLAALRLLGHGDER